MTENNWNYFAPGYAGVIGFGYSSPIWQLMPDQESYWLQVEYQNNKQFLKIGNGTFDPYSGLTSIKVTQGTEG